MLNTSMHIINITMLLLTTRYIKMLKYIITETHDISAAKELINKI